ncbi:MAG: hypothetical protein QOH76_669, partial [Thermoleophilaceae bacterium]|nr:hypothetical protein [Thermoleophilaceae bacterium]
MPDTRYFFACAHEQFPPDDLLKQAVEAEDAGFDGIACSDHFQPWWEPGESGHAWVWLGAVGQVTSRVPLGTAVTPPGGLGGGAPARAFPASRLRPAAIRLHFPLYMRGKYDRMSGRRLTR